MMTPPYRLRFVRPLLPPPAAWARYLEPAYRQRQFSNRGPVVQRLEEALAEHLAPAGRQVTVVASATAGLTLALQALGVEGPVACPSFTFAATAQAILAAGCTPWFCDVDPVTWELTPATLAPAVAAGVRAVMHVRALGRCLDLSRLESYAGARGLPLIVDAAACLGGLLPSGARVGGQGTVEVVSMHATKAFGIGEGGAILCPPALRRALIERANFGQMDGDICGRGANGKMGEFQAAVGLAVLDAFAGRQRVRQRNFSAYDAHFQKTLGTQAAGGGGRAAAQCYPLLLPVGERNTALARFAHRRGVELRPYYCPPLHRARGFAPLPRASHMATAEALSDRMICLPVYPDMSEAERATVVDVVDAWRRGAGRRRRVPPRPRGPERAPSLAAR